MSDAEPASSHLRIQTVTVPVSDIDRSLVFYEEALGFRILWDFTVPSGVRVAFVAPPDGVATLMLSDADPNKRLGTHTGVTLLTDDIEVRHREWAANGVRFSESPRPLLSGSRYATLLDPDDNAFRLVETDAMTEQLEKERRALADREERERRAAYEISVATQVQAGLFPRRQPAMAMLDYAGVCLQARQVGGDYFDFLNFGDGRLGLVVGDVSGKGLGAALLMANLQAHVRGQYAAHGDDLPAMLTSVNVLFHESAPAASYASLFFGAYDDRTRRLRFVNCGHPPAAVLRANGATEWLEPTGPVLGMFEQWTGTAREVALGDGDILALYTDGVSEAFDDAGDQFGGERLAAVLREAGDTNAKHLLDCAVAAVRAFGRGDQWDDITMVIACCRG